MKVCIVGGGAGGMMSALMIAKKGHQVVLLEKNEKLGKKLYITGKGRCNVTNAVTGNEFLANVVNNPKFIMSSEVRFNSQDTMNLFEELGVKLKIERGNRVFPQSDKASDITRALENGMKKYKVQVILNSEVVEILVKDANACGVKLANGQEILSDAVVVATGGISYPLTGSTGDGYKFAQATGHKVVPPVPGLVAILTNDMDLFGLSGLSLKNVRLYALKDNKEIFKSDIGEMLITGNGISGPLALTLSSYINRISPENLEIYIDFKPALDNFALLSRIERDIRELKGKQFSSLLEGLLPNSLVDVFVNRLGIPREKKVAQITREERENLCKMLKKFELEFLKLDSIERAVITSGGVSTKDIKPKSMESKVVNKLYFVGEVVDVDALTGGFNLQLAFSMASSCASDF